MWRISVSAPYSDIVRMGPVLLLCVILQCTKRAVAEQCWQGATFSEAIVSPDLKSSNILRVPETTSLAQCAGACCDLPGCDLAWFFQRRCYVLSCLHQENCQPRQRPGADSYVTFLRRGPPQALVLQSLVRGQPRPGRWRPLPRPPGGDAAALQDLALFNGMQPGFADPSLMDAEYPESYRSLEDGGGDRGGAERDRGGSEAPTAEQRESSGYLDWPAAAVREGFNLSETAGVQGAQSGLLLHSPASIEDDRPRSTEQAPPTSSAESVPQGFANGLLSQESVSSGGVEPTASLQRASTDSTPQGQVGTCSSTECPPPVLTTSPPTGASQQVMNLLEDPTEATPPTGAVQLNVSVSPQPSEPHTGTGMGTGTDTDTAAHVNLPPTAIASPRAQDVLLPATSAFIDGGKSTDDVGIVSYRWEEVTGPSRERLTSADTAVLHLSDLRPGNYTFRLTVTDSEGLVSSTLATVRATQLTDRPPVASAGPDRTIALPLDRVTLSGNQSSDDHGIVGYLWSLSPGSRAKAATMQGTRTPNLQLSGLREGEYTFHLTVTDTSGQQDSSTAVVKVQPERNRAPVAAVGPDRQLTLPVNASTLDGSRSTDDQGIITYLWEVVSGPPGIKIKDADKAVAMAMGFKEGKYTFRLTVSDQQGAADSTSLTIAVREARHLPPVAHASGSHTLTLPQNSLVLRGSVSGADAANVSYLWVRDEQSPAVGDVLYGSERQANLYLANLAEGTYLFLLRVTDGHGLTSTSTASVEVRPDPNRGDEVELELQVPVSQVSRQQRDTVIRQLAVLLHVLDSDIVVQGLNARSEVSTVMRFSVRGQDGPIPGLQLARRLQGLLLKEKTDFLLFRALRVDTAMCWLPCSDHGRCDPLTRRCACDPFWMESPVRHFLQDSESNCDWSVLYVIIFSFVGVVFLMSAGWAFVCCCKRRKRTKVRKKNKYTILDNMDDQERMELRPKYNIKHRSTEHNSSLMMSESEFESEQDTIFTREKQDRVRGRPNGVGADRNAEAFSPRPVDG